MEDGRAQAVEVVSTKCPKGDLDSATLCRRASAMSHQCRGGQDAGECNDDGS